MDLQIEKRTNVDVLKYKGRLDVNTAENFRNKANETINSGGLRLAIDFADITFVDSSGLGALVNILRTANQKGGDVKLFSLKPEIRMVIELTRLNKVFQIFNSEEETVTSFK